MRTNEQGDKVACSKCRSGHRTSTCVDARDHQDNVQVIRRAGRPEGSRTDPARAVERREMKRKRQMEKELREEDAAFRQEAHPFYHQRAASDPLQGNLAAGYPSIPVPGYQNRGSLANPHAPVPSFPRRSSYPPDPLPATLPEPIQRLLERPHFPGAGYGPAPPPLAVPLPAPVPGVPDFPLTAPNHAASVVPFGMSGSGYIEFETPMSIPGPHSLVPSLGSGVIGNSFDAMAQNSLVNNWVTGFPRVDMMAQADQERTMMFQTNSEDLMEAGDTVLPDPFAPFSAPVPLNEDTRGMISWDEFIPGQTF